MKLGLRNLRRFAGDWAAQFDAAQAIGADYLQVDGVPDADVTTVSRLMDQTGVRLWSVTALSTAMLGPDMERSREEQGKTRAAIHRAAELGAPCVSMFAGHDPDIDLDANVERFREVFGPLAKYAEDQNVTLVFENCPMTGGMPPAPRNLAYCPDHWERIFEAVPSHALGLEMDFGHLPALRIDPVRAVRDFAPRIRHVGMKDARIDPEAVYRRGWGGPGTAAFCIPGEGDLDFAAIIAALDEAGYEGPLTLDHIHAATDTVETFQQGAAHLRTILEPSTGVTD